MMTEPTVQMAVIPEKQRKDMAASAAPANREVFDDIYRVKQYVKPEEMSYGVNPRDLSFEQPWQVASRWCDANAANRVFLGETVDCNLDCSYCYRGENKETRNVTATEYVDAFFNHFLQCDHIDGSEEVGVLRVSGGEPMLHQDWVAGVCQSASRFSADRGTIAPYLWIDTNGTIHPTSNLCEKVCRQAVGVCLCFKPGVDGVTIAQQLEVANDFVTCGADVYFSYPSWDGALTTAAGFIPEIVEGLRDIHSLLPLRMSVIEIKNYETNKSRPGFHESDKSLRTRYRERKRALREICESLYEPELLWLPSHQVPIH